MLDFVEIKRLFIHHLFINISLHSSGFWVIFSFGVDVHTISSVTVFTVARHKREGRPDSFFSLQIDMCIFSSVYSLVPSNVADTSSAEFH